MRLLVILFFVTNLMHSQIEVNAKNAEHYAPVFSTDIINSAPTENGKTKVDIYFRFPYSNLQFVKSGNKYTAGYTLTIEVIDEDSKNVVTSDLLEKTIETKTYESSVSSRSNKITMRSLILAPGKYTFRITLIDSESSKKYTTFIKKKVLNSAQDIYVSDILLIKNSVKIAGKEQLVPNVSRITQDIQQNLPFYFNINSKKEISVKLVYKIIDDQEDEIFEFTETQKLTVGNNPIIKTVTKLNLILGKHTLVVKGSTVSGNIFTQKKEFRSVLKGFPASITDLDLAIRQIKFIATSEEMDALENDSLSYLQKKERFTTFWKSKDPDPTTPFNEVLTEFYRRVEYANMKFKGYSEGWRSDMGYVYILLGAPDSINRNPFSSSNKPYEIWYYNRLSKRFIFIDKTGFGEYKLMNYDYRDMTRFRY